jgi:hypothetical protein
MFGTGSDQGEAPSNVLLKVTQTCKLEQLKALVHLAIVARSPPTSGPSLLKTVPLL